MPEVRFSSNTFDSMFGVFLWFTREELQDPEQFQAALEQAYKLAASTAESERQKFLQKSQYDAIVVPLDK